jgi:homoserine kinase
VKPSDLKLKEISVFAPATVANLATGFDILGLAIEGVGDTVTVSCTSQTGVTIEALTGNADASSIPTDPLKNTAGFPLTLMLEKFKPPFGFSVRIQKGIPLGSGMGGSAASAVGAVVAAHELLVANGVISKLNLDELISYALEGEAVASGSKHADNIAPCLYGGLTLSFPGNLPQVSSVPYPENLFCVVVHPDLRLDTKTAREVLKKELSLKNHIEQSARLASLLLGFATSDFKLIARGLDDVLIEPQRARLIPGFAAVKAAALKAGCLGASISGAGPSVFALTSDLKVAESARALMIEAFQTYGKLPASGWISRIRKSGASKA